VLARPRALALAEPVGGHVLAVAAAVFLLMALCAVPDAHGAPS
jgi:hypothetical protein